MSQDGYFPAVMQRINVSQVSPEVGHLDLAKDIQKIYLKKTMVSVVKRDNTFHVNTMLLEC